jgi:quercetin dioxygenase-like cupin family protein
MMTALQTKLYALKRDEEQSIQTKGALISIKANTEQTGGAFNLFAVTCLPHYSTALHIHYAEDVALYVLEGALILFWGNERMAAVAGAYFCQPLGTPAWFSGGR